MPLVQELYFNRIETGRVQPNPAQAQAVEYLDRLSVHQLGASEQQQRIGLLAWLGRILFGHKPADNGPGIYIHGPVGRGKTLVMDLFVEALAESPVRVKRTHFHQFFASVHADIHARRSEGLSTEDVMNTLAQELAQHYDVLAFDEFYVNNIADAMILGRYLDTLFKAGIALIFTSNDAPEDLYRGGLQRERFVPAIELIKNQCDVVFIDTGVDYRLLQRRLPSTFLSPLGPAATRFLDACLSELTGDTVPTELTLFIGGGRMQVPKAAGGFAQFSFAQLCEQPLGRNEYIALTREFTGLLLSDVPALNPQNADAAERFRVLIDILYDQRRFLTMTAAKPIEQLPEGPDAQARLARTVSRLIEMQSPDYVSQALG